MLYHVSGKHHLTVLRPKVSSHGKAYVYAVDNLTLGLLFGARKDDFDFIMDADGQGCAEVFECYPQAFEEVYRGVSCSVYTLDNQGFQSGLTGWAPEYVCERDVIPLSEDLIPDLYERLIAEPGLILHRYENTRAYRQMISNHVLDRLVRFGVLDRLEVDEKLTMRYGKIIGALREILDGELL